MNKENCALKLVDEIILYYDARSKKHQMFGMSLCPSSGERTACHCLWFSVLAVAVVVPESLVARCVHCGEDFA